MFAAAVAGSSCFYDLDAYHTSEGSGGASSSATTASQMSSTGQGSTVTTDASNSSSSVGGGLPVGVTHCLRQGQTETTFDRDAFADTQNCKATGFWRPNAPLSIDTVCPDQPQPGSAVVSVVPQAGAAFKLAGALGPLELDVNMMPKPRHELQFTNCYVAIAVPDTSQIGVGDFAYAGLVTGATNASINTTVDIRPAHTGPLVYGVIIDKDRVARPGDKTAAPIGSILDFVRFGETNGTFVIETKAKDDAEWTTLFQAPFTKPANLDLFFGFGLQVENPAAAATVKFDDYNLDP